MISHRYQALKQPKIEAKKYLFKSKTDLYN